MIPVFSDEIKAHEQIIKPSSRRKLRRVLGDITNNTPVRSTGPIFKSKSRGLSINTNSQSTPYPRFQIPQSLSPQIGCGNLNKPKSSPLIQRRFTENRLQLYSQSFQQSSLNPREDEEHMDDVEIGTIVPFDDHIVPDVAVDMKQIAEGLDIHQSSILGYDPVPARLEMYEDSELDDLLNADDSDYKNHRPILADITSAVLSGAMRTQNSSGQPNATGSENIPLEVFEVKTEDEDVENAHGTMHYNTPLPSYDAAFDFNVSKYVTASQRIGGIPSYRHSPIGYETFGDSNFDDGFTTFSLGELEEGLDSLLDF